MPAWAIQVSFVLTFFCGVGVLIWTLAKPPVNDSGSGKIKIGKWEFEFNGRAIFQLTMGAAFVAFPAVLAVANEPASTAPPPRQYQQVDTIPDPSYSAFSFVKDVSILDLREEQKGSLLDMLPWLKTKSHPATLTNAMTIRKTGDAQTISFTYGTSGSIDVRCVTHKCGLRRAVTPDEHGTALNETWEVTAVVADIPVGTTFDLITEVTYWNAFDAPEKQWYASYPNAQNDDELVSILVLFPRDKPFTDFSTWRYPHGSKVRQRFGGVSRSVPGPDDLSLYWEVPKAQGTDTLEVRWSY